MSLKEDFYWGNSVSSMQTEGGWKQGGKSLSVYDIKEASKNTSDWHFANDNYNNYEEDLDLIEDLGMNMYRFQISWSRVVVDGDGEFNEEGIEYYDRFIDALIERGIEPMICLYHFDMPLHLAEKYNGFLSREVTEAFVRYGIEMIKRFGHKVKHWLTFNEQNFYQLDPNAFELSGYLEGDQTIEELYQIHHNVTMAHAYVANYIHENTDCKISGMVMYQEVYPATSHPKDIFMARQFDEFANHNLIEVFVNGHYPDSFWAFVEKNEIDLKIQEGDLDILGKLYSDYLTFSYYQSLVLDHRDIPEGTAPNQYLLYGQKDNPYLESSEWNWQIDPLGFRNVLNKMYSRYKLPIFPIENGIGVIEEWDGENPIQDDYRIDYIRDHIQAIKDAIEIDGVEVMGYLGWGLIDILSSQGDMRKRYGVVYVNRTNHDLRDMKRVPKKSYEWLKEVIRTNGNNI